MLQPMGCAVPGSAMAPMWRLVTGVDVLGPHPSFLPQAYTMKSPTIVPPLMHAPPTWDSAGLVAAMNNLSLQVPGGWIMDSGATSHMTFDDGILSKPTTLPSTTCVIVGNGSTVSISRMGNTHLSTPSTPFKPTDVLVVPSLIKSLIFIHKFTCDNSCSIEFDSLGFSINNLHTKTMILHYNSQGALYTIFPTTPMSSPHAFLSATSPHTLSHHLLGHPVVMRCLLYPIYLTLHVVRQTNLFAMHFN